MDYPTAQKLMSVYERMGKLMMEADTVIRTLPDAERSEHIRALAGLNGHLWSTLQRPIVLEYADLDPDADYFRNKSSGKQAGE